MIIFLFIDVADSKKTKRLLQSLDLMIIDEVVKFEDLNKVAEEILKKQQK